MTEPISDAVALDRAAELLRPVAKELGPEIQFSLICILAINDEGQRKQVLLSWIGALQEAGADN